MAFVIDNSVVCGWLLENQASDYADGIARRLTAERAVAPGLLVLEYTNVLRTACRRQQTVASRAQEMLAMLTTLPIDIDTTIPNAAQLFALALRYDLTSYDALYLDLALRRSLPIATRDAALADAALAAGLGVVPG